MRGRKRQAQKQDITLEEILFGSRALARADTSVFHQNSFECNILFLRLAFPTRPGAHAVPLMHARTIHTAFCGFFRK